MIVTPQVKILQIITHFTLQGTPKMKRLHVGAADLLWQERIHRHYPSGNDI